MDTELSLLEKTDFQFLFEAKILMIFNIIHTNMYINKITYISLNLNYIEG